ncbi:amidase family protein [Mesorhizobium sangaii]|nr:amidase family protein [Mesorhizobium sangaii]
MPVFNITGQPSVSLPLAQSADGLPIGLQIVGRFWRRGHAGPSRTRSEGS